ncbi:hypothetical protein ACIQC9_02945 [Brevundimonas sp. NPDC092305]|uniref:hypothetical protein n=1 Tax=Brevundimonas sp. NPDC092305 TaxID=3363957 RepID=UPI0038299421
MRYILCEDVEVELPPDWDTIVGEARQHVIDKTTAARDAAAAEGATPEAAEVVAMKALHKAVAQKASVWGKAAPALMRASDEKCWYCEKRQVRSDNPIDHFRPKGRVHGAPDHPGYWWRAFDWKNFRLSCTYCNSRRRDVETGRVGGKQDFFPVLEPPPRQGAEGDPDDRPRLLDPLVDADTKMITYLANGYPAPVDENPASEARARVLCSIDLYHLDQAALVRERKQLAIDIRSFVEAGQQADQAGDAVGRQNAKTELIKRVRRKAELSSAARIFLGAYKQFPWVQEIFDRDL